MSGLGGLNKTPDGVVIGLVQLQLPTIAGKSDSLNFKKFRQWRPNPFSSRFDRRRRCASMCKIGRDSHCRSTIFTKLAAPIGTRRSLVPSAVPQHQRVGCGAAIWRLARPSPLSWGTILTMLISPVGEDWISCQWGRRPKYHLKQLRKLFPRARPSPGLLLALSSDQQFLQMVWAIDALRSSRPEAAAQLLTFPPQAADQSMGSRPRAAAHA